MYHSSRGYLVPGTLKLSRGKVLAVSFLLETIRSGSKSHDQEELLAL